MIKAQVELLVVVENSIFRKYLANNYNNRQAALARIRRYYGIVVAMVSAVVWLVACVHVLV